MGHIWEDESEKKMKSGWRGGKISCDSSLHLSKSITECVLLSVN